MSVLSEAEHEKASVTVLKGKITECSTAFLNLTGYESDKELEGKRLSDIAPEYQEGWRSSRSKEIEIYDTINRDEKLEIPWIGRKKNGSCFHSRLKGSKYRCGNQEFYHLRVNPLDNFLPRTEEKGINHLITGLAHHINTPLGNIITSSSYLLSLLQGSDNSDPPVESFLEIIQKSAEKIAAIMNELKTLIPDDIEGSYGQINIEELERGLGKHFSGNLYFKRDNDFTFSTCRISLLNALIKILNFLKKNDKYDHDVTLQASRKDKEIIFSISQTGKPAYPRIYESFHTPFIIDRPGSVDGFGLYAAGHLIRENLGGSISVEREEDKTAITITIPID